VSDGPVVTSAAAADMASGARRALRCDVALSLTGVAGPDVEDGVEVGTVFVGLALGEGAPTTTELHLPGDRARVREYATISGLDVVRRALDALG
jgi:nicotinamide-nucleotide amidase